MKRITKIRIPKGKKCGKCIALWQSAWCNLFEDEVGETYSHREGYKFFRCDDCLKMFPNGAVFELKEKK